MFFSINAKYEMHTRNTWIKLWGICKNFYAPRCSIKWSKFGYYSSHLREILSTDIFDKIITDFWLSLIKSSFRSAPNFHQGRKRQPARILPGVNFHRHENWVHVAATDVSCHSNVVSDVLSACHAAEKNSSVTIIFAVSYERDGGDLVSIFTIDEKPRVSSWLIFIGALWLSLLFLSNWLASELNLILTVFLTKFSEIRKYLLLFEYD